MSRNFAAHLQKRRAYELTHSGLRYWCKETNIIPDYQSQPHDEMCDQIEEMEPQFGTQKVQRKKLYLAPRHSYKTSIIEAFICYLLCKYPNIKILVYRANDELAQGILGKVKLILETNDEIKFAFGDLSRGALKWAENAIVTGTRTRPDRDPSVATAGLRVSTTGMHPDVVLMDDIVARENCDSIVEMERGWGILQSMYPLLPPHGTILVTGTRWSNIDTYSRIIELVRSQKEKGEEESYAIYRREVYYTDANGEQKLFFPAKLTEAFLEQQRRDLEPRWFYAWYYNQSYEPGHKPFTNLQFFDTVYHRGLFNYIVLEPPEFNREKLPLGVAFAMDCALTATTESDRFGIVAAGIDFRKDWWTLEAHEWHKLPSDVTIDVGRMLMEYEPEIFLIESQNADVRMVARIQDIIRDLGLVTQIISYSALQDEEHGKRGKIRRIESLEPIVRQGRVWIRRGYCGDLVSQLDLYPGIAHNDVIDAFAMMHRAFDRIKPPAETYELAMHAPLDDGKEVEDKWKRHIEEMQIYHGVPERRVQSGDRGDGMWTGGSRTQPQIILPR